jgi:thiol-disulfide isomerase/thioredoxin
MKWVLYTRKGCGLCEDMELSLGEYSRRYRNALPEYQTIDIDTDDELKKRFNADVPLLLNQDEVILQYFFDEARLKQVLMHD